MDEKERKELERKAETRGLIIGVFTGIMIVIIPFLVRVIFEVFIR